MKLLNFLFACLAFFTMAVTVNAKTPKQESCKKEEHRTYRCAPEGSAYSAICDDGLHWTVTVDRGCRPGEHCINNPQRCVNTAEACNGCDEYYDDCSNNLFHDCGKNCKADCERRMCQIEGGRCKNQCVMERCKKWT
ncbi:hypothetical protein NX059_006155 [Plenodomus lindquistii]|nr:hypothetical protein NX059_006155 [Plenodomus lindquistii]